LKRVLQPGGETPKPTVRDDVNDHQNDDVESSVGDDQQDVWSYRIPFLLHELKQHCHLTRHVVSQGMLMQLTLHSFQAMVLSNELLSLCRLWSSRTYGMSEVARKIQV
jgi:hypothetical protein